MLRAVRYLFGELLGFDLVVSCKVLVSIIVRYFNELKAARTFL